MTHPREQSFWAKVAVSDDPNACWEWQASLSGGYGRFGFWGRGALAHRVAYFFTHGEVPDGALVCHSCDNPRCVNPAHLFLGTHKDNSDDKFRKGRDRKACGEANSKAKLTSDDVRAIRASPDIQIVLAARYGVSQSQISAIRRGANWSHVTNSQGAE